ncbi:metallophosphatase [Flavobacteriales bacterium]|nr:metallophosphatase [Flavobacteriales bacterium]
MGESKSFNRRIFIKKITLASISLTLLNSFSFLNKKTKTKKITILHTNDMHSHIDPFRENHSKYPGLGGMKRVASLVKKIRTKEKNVVLIDAGDVFQGTPYFNKYKGSLELKIMSEMGYIASTMGNHDFDNGINGFKEVLHHANFPFICSNYEFSDIEMNKKIKKYLVTEIDGIKIGLFGIGIELEGLVGKDYYGDTKYLDPIDSSNYWSNYLKSKEKCDLIICISHLGYEYKNDKISDLKLARLSKNIDVIIGGHTHTFLEKAEKIKNLENKNVIVNQAGWGALALGRIDIEFSKNNDKLNSLSVNAIDKKNYAKI